MHVTSVPQSGLPLNSRLAADACDRPERVVSFYRHPRRDLASFQAAAAEIRFPVERRAALVAALRARNPESAALERLARPGTVVVAAGQQAGLFSGPAYSVYKALHAAKLAAWLTDNGLPAVPVFWLATEDHDFAEVNHVWVFDAQHRPAKVEAGRAASGQPAGLVELPAPPVRELLAAMEGLPFAAETALLVEECYRPGGTMGEGFGALLRRLLRDFDIPQIDPLLPQFRELAAPLLRAAVEAAPELSARVLERGRELTAAGYHAQVHVEEHTSFVFLLENGKRLALRRQGGEYALNGRRIGATELMDCAASLSPNALLRPVAQDSMLPTAAYIGGPAEIAYLAQSEAIYRALLGRMPVAVPRAGFTILDAHSQKLMERYGLALPDFFAGEDALRERVAARLVPPSLAASVREAAASVESAVDRLRGDMAGFDPTLGRALDRGARKIRYQIEKIGRKAAREALSRDARARRDATSLYGLIYPERHLQERLYSILPFLAKHGPTLIERVYDALQPDSPDHRILALEQIPASSQ
ncbi:MAG: bacillithiol biosynthesis cysteine-adding enzyme BshC [Bryobacteraceae bacterium]|jgi:bacillithiol biosynthesis cysteine-adding enzyme BshC